jgi:tRNA(fMet)-specific endonuclease VapC
MQRYCLETSFIVDFLREKEDAIEKYKEIKGRKLETTSVVAWEVLRGPKLTGRVKEYKEAVKLFERLNILPFTLTSSRIASEIELDLKEKGSSVNLIDVLIAAAAIENSSKLVTRDEGYMNIRGLEVEFY